MFYPCDNYDYPGACSRYKTVHVIRREYRAKKTTMELIQECEKLSGKFRLGCFHGIGNAHMGLIAFERMNITDICLSGTEQEQFMCIEGMMERLSKYFGKERAFEICSELDGRNNDICMTAAENGMYTLEKDFTIYLTE